MRYRGQRWLLALSLLGVLWFGSVRSEERVEWPIFRNDKDVAEFLNYVSEEIPDLFSTMTEYGTDLFQVLRRHQDLLDELEHQPHLKELVSIRPDRKSLDVKIVKASQKAAAAPKATDAQLAGLTDSLRETLRSLPQDMPLRQALREGLDESSRTVPKAVFNAYLADLMKNMIPEADRRALGALSTEGKLERLKQMPAEQLAIEKVYSPGKISAYGIQGENAVSLFEKLMARDARIEQLALLAALTESEPANATVAAYAKILRAPTAEDLAPLSNPELTANQLRKLMAEGGQSPKENIDLIAKQGGASLAKAAKKLGFEAAAPEPAPLVEVKLVEQPTFMRWFRGCAGSDCATKHMPYSGDSPYDKTFFVEADSSSAGIRNMPKGYVQGYVVESFHKRYLYIQIVNGRTISPKVLDALLRGLDKAKTALGVEGIILPDESHLSSNMNFESLRAPMRQIQQQSQKVAFMPLDSELRGVIDRFTNHSPYRNGDAELNGYLYQPTPLGNEEVRVGVTDAPPQHFEKKPLTHGRAALLALELEQIGRRDLADAVLHSASVTPDEYERLKSAIMNEKHLPFADYLKQVTATLKKAGYDLDPTFKTNRMDPFYSALLRAPDAFSPALKSKSIGATISMLRKGVDLSQVSAVIKDHRAEFESNPQLQATLVGLFECENQYGPAWARAAALGDANFSLKQMPEVAKKLAAHLASDSRLRTAGGGILVKMNQNLDQALPVLFGLARESNGVNGEVNYLFKEAYRRDPAEFERQVMAGLESGKDWVQKGALYAVEKTDLRSAPVKTQVDKIALEGLARTHEAYLQAIWLKDNQVWSAPDSCVGRAINHLETRAP